MLLALLVYLLLAARVTACAFVGIGQGHGCSYLEIGLLGITFRLDGVLVLPDTGGIARPALRYFRRKRPHQSARQRAKAARSAYPYMKAVLRRCHLEGFELNACIGLGDACMTALASGAVRAAASGVLARAATTGLAIVHVVPLYDRPCLLADVRCIFSAPVGDIMFAVIAAALREAAKKRRKRDSHGKASD